MTSNIPNNENHTDSKLLHDSSMTEIPLRNSGVIRFGWLIPILVAFAVYYVALNNFFTHDDFLWLYRARTFKQDWLQIFRIDVTYFDPLVHLMFWVNYLIGGLDPRWYHGVDIAIHAANSLLIYYVSRLLGGDERASIYGGILFASSFAIADAILWSSSRVDLLSTFFSLCALTQFLLYLRSEKRRNLLLSFMLFILALGAKGTPLILPLILLWLIIQEKKPIGYALRLIPFGVVVILYIILLKLTTNNTSLTIGSLNFNIGNIVMAFCALFIPEVILDGLNFNITAACLFVVVSALGLIALPLKSTIMLRRTGYCILLVAIMPVLITTNFRIPTRYSDPYLVFASPSHRIYLASVGTALLGGGLLRSIEILFGKYFQRISTVAIVLLLAGVVTGNAYLVRERDQLWETMGNRAKNAFNGLQHYRQQVGEGSLIELAFFPGGGFVGPMAKMSLDINDATIQKDVYIGKILDPEILSKAEKSFLFVFGRDGHVYDKSQQYRQLLLFSRMAMLNPNYSLYDSTCQAITMQLIRDVERIK